MERVFLPLGSAQTNELEVKGHVLILQFEHPAPHTGKRPAGAYCPHRGLAMCGRNPEKRRVSSGVRCSITSLSLTGHFDPERQDWGSGWS